MSRLRKLDIWWLKVHLGRGIPHSTYAQMGGGGSAKSKRLHAKGRGFPANMYVCNVAAAIHPTIPKIQRGGGSKFLEGVIQKAFACVQMEGCQII